MQAFKTGMGEREGAAPPLRPTEGRPPQGRGRSFGPTPPGLLLVVPHDSATKATYSLLSTVAVWVTPVGDLAAPGHDVRVGLHHAALERLNALVMGTTTVGLIGAGGGEVAL